METVLAYGGGGESGVVAGRRERVKELECDGLEFFNALSARAKIELDVG